MNETRERRVKIFLDSGDLRVLREFAARSEIRGVTTNATLMHRAGVRDLRAFARELIALYPDRPVSLPVPVGAVDAMERDAREIASWRPNVYVKVAITTPDGAPTTALLRRLSASGVRVNVTAVFTAEQVREAAEALRGGAPSFVSVLAGRIADTGRDPLPILRAALDHLRDLPTIELMWASPREVLNVVQADAIGCHVITMTRDLVDKLSLFGKDLETYSLETVRSLEEDAAAAGYRL